MQDELRRALDAIPGLVWSTVPDGHVDFLNQRWREYTRLSLEDACGWEWQAAICPDDRSRLLSHWRSPTETGKPGEIEARLRGFDGASRRLLIRAVPVRDETGALTRRYGQSTDIEDRLVIHGDDGQTIPTGMAGLSSAKILPHATLDVEGVPGHRTGSPARTRIS